MKQSLCVFVAVLLVLVSGTVSGLNEDQDEGILLVKPGKCAPSKQFMSCPQSPPNECILDVDCDAKKKCCFTGCAMHCAEPTQNKDSGKVCEVPIDLGFLIDSSASIGEENFKKIKKMIHKALNIFTISDRKTRVGAVMIDSVPKIVLNFNTLTGDALNAKNVGEILERVQFLEGKTRIDLALRMAYKELFTKAAGARKYARKVLLIFTDGGQTRHSLNTLNLTKTAQPLKQMGVQIFPVALWDHELNIGTLLDIASDDHNVFNVEFYPELLAVLKKITKVRCTGKNTKMAQKDPLEALLKRKKL